MRTRTSRRAARGVLAGAMVAAVALVVPAAQAQDDDPLRRTGSDRSQGPAAGKPDKAARPGLSKAPGAQTAVPGEVLVRYANGVSVAKRGAVRSAVGGRLERTLPVRGLEVLKVDGGVNRAVEALERRPEVLYAEPNFVYSIEGMPNDPKLPQLWGLHNRGQVVDGQAGTADADIDAPEAWDNTTGEASVTVAVVDSGVAYDHPDLAANIWTNPGETRNGIDDDRNGYVDDTRGWDWSGDDNDPMDANGHGSHVAGTIGATGDNGIGVTGVSQDVSLMPLRVMGADGTGTLADILAGFAYAAGEGADVVNVSLGGPEHSQAMADVIAGAPQTLFVVAAGNTGVDTTLEPTYPCSLPATNIVCVAATDNRDRLAAFSNYGTRFVDLGAPGVGIVSTVPARRTVMSDRVEGAWRERWVTGGTRAWGIQSSTARGQFLSDSPGARYAPYADTWVRPRSAVNLAGLKDCTLEYLLNLDTEDGYDGFLAEAALAGGSYRTLAGWTGDWGGWVPMKESLAAFDGARAVNLRFSLVSDGNVEHNGAYVDDVAVRCSSSAYSGGEYASYDGTSMASPHVAGAAALLFAAAPWTDVSTVRTALLTGVDVKSGLTGMTATGGRLNVRNSLDRMPAAVGFRDAALSVAESGGAATVVVRRSGDITSPASVDFATSDGTAVAGSDYVQTSGTLSFAPGQAAASLTVPISDDAVFEGDETLTLDLASSVGAPLASSSTATLTLRDNDQAVVAFAEAARAVAENAGTVEVQLERTGNVAAPAAVTYSRASGSAAAGDHSLAPGTVTFAAGQTSASFEVPITNDSTREGAETLVLSLASGQRGTTIGKIGSTTLTIAASDQQPDGWISTARSSGFVGNDIYNGTGRKQTRTASARRTQARTFYVRVYNDGNATNTFVVKGSAALSRSTVRYLAGATDVTSAMRSAAGWKVRLSPGRFRLVTVKVKVLTRAAFGSLKTATVSATWTGDGARTDVTRAVVKVVR